MWPGVRSYESMPVPLKARPAVIVVIIGGIVTVVAKNATRRSGHGISSRHEFRVSWVELTDGGKEGRGLGLAGRARR